MKELAPFCCEPPTEKASKQNTNFFLSNKLNQGEEQEGEKKISSRHTYQKAPAGCWIVRVPGLKYSSTAQEREKP
jgi:hypothetical protein